MMEYLIFRLYGPMAAWGQAAIGGERPVEARPTKSAIIGLLAAALGIKRDDKAKLTQLDTSVKLGIKTICTGELISDFHTTQVPSQNQKGPKSTRKDELNFRSDNLNTILSNREYTVGGVWIIAIWLNEQSELTLSKIHEALLHPKFTLYLGRKSCPLALPLEPRIISNETLKNALDSEFQPVSNLLSEVKRQQKKSNIVTYYWEGDENRLGIEKSLLISVKTLQRWDRPLNKIRWQFTTRMEHSISIEE